MKVGAFEGDGYIISGDGYAEGYGNFFEGDGIYVKEGYGIT